MNKATLILFLLASSLLRGCATEEICSGNEPKCLKREMRKHVAKTEAYWRKKAVHPFAKRVYAAPEELIKFLHLEARFQQIPNRAVSSGRDDFFIEEVQQALEEIPQKVKSKLDGRFLGVYLVNGLGATGLTVTVHNKFGKQVAGIVMLDEEVLASKTANEWATWKESTPFKKGDFRIEARIETDENNNRKNAIQFILLHELGHIYGINSWIHPDWNTKPSELNDLSNYKFIKFSWKPDKTGEKYLSRYDGGVWKGRHMIEYYWEPTARPNKEMIGHYHSLGLTNLPTLYAATNPFDDWAESFATFIHTEILHKPYEIKIMKGDKVVGRHQLCWKRGTCLNKYNYLKGELGER